MSLSVMQCVLNAASVLTQSKLFLAAQGKRFVIELETKQTNKPKHNADN